MKKKKNTVFEVFSNSEICTLLHALEKRTSSNFLHTVQFVHSLVTVETKELYCTIYFVLSP